MNTLTKNRILQEGDEYLDKNGKWKPVPKTDFGLQIMFTQYAEVRRPSEKTFTGSGESLPSLPAAAELSESRAAKAEVTGNRADAGRVESRPQSPPISPDSARIESGAAKAESEKSPVPTHSGTGALPQNYKGLIPAAEKAEAAARLAHSVSHLPTVVSKKAHKHPDPASMPAVKAFIEKRLPAVVAAAKPNGSVAVDWKEGEAPCIWIGRNGTFKCRALKLHHCKGGQIRIVPVGKRGTARNAVIEFPASITKQVIAGLEHLLTNSITKTPK